MLKRLREKNYYSHIGEDYVNDKHYVDAQKLTQTESLKRPFRFDVINFLLKKLDRKTTYLEIGVRNPDDNFNKIEADVKYSVDPNLEFDTEFIDFKMTSDEFFSRLRDGEILDSEPKFDVIFVDGLHLAEQAERDIANAIGFIKDDGFVVVHDCNPPTEFHAREDYGYDKSPAEQFWNGTTWKAFYKNRLNPNVSSCCIDSDWGVGVIMKNQLFPSLKSDINPFYEYKVFDENRRESLNLIDFDAFQKIISAQST